MRLGYVRGQVVLNTSIPQLSGIRLLVVEPVNAVNLEAKNGQGGGKALIVADHENGGVGRRRRTGKGVFPKRKETIGRSFHACLVFSCLGLCDFHCLSKRQSEPGAGSLASAGWRITRQSEIVPFRRGDFFSCDSPVGAQANLNAHVH